MAVEYRPICLEAYSAAFIYSHLAASGHIRLLSDVLWESVGCFYSVPSCIILPFLCEEGFTWY